MLPFPRNYRSWILDTIEPVCKIGIDIDHLSRGMGWELVFKLAESAENRRMPSLLINCHSDSFFTTSWACEDCGEFLFDDPNYSPSSSPQLKRLSSSERVGVNIYLWFEDRRHFFGLLVLT